MPTAAHLSREDVRAAQASMDYFCRKYGLAVTPLKGDGRIGPKTRRRVMTCKYYLGYGKSRGSEITPEFVRRLRNPHSRRFFPRAHNHRMMRTGESRREERRRAVAAVKRHRESSGRGPHAARALALRYAGMRIVEHPAGSNAGPYISGWDHEWGFGSVAWCGIFAGHVARACGAKGLTSRVASVAAIEDDARAHRNGFRGWQGAGSRGAHIGSFVVMFGRGVHVEMVVGRYAGGYVTVGGNTSFEGGSGSQSNGGCVAKRYRPYYQVHGVALVNWG